MQKRALLARSVGFIQVSVKDSRPVYNTAVINSPTIDEQTCASMIEWGFGEI